MHFKPRLKPPSRWRKPTQPADPIKSARSADRKLDLNSLHQPTDTVLADRVTHAMWEDDILRHTDYSEIGVRVVDGVVYLSGHVTGAAYEKRADTAARSVKGIRDIKSLLVRDDELLISAAGALGKLENIHNIKFFTGVNSGVVSLNGKVDSGDMRLLAEQYVAAVPGVRGVINNVIAEGAKAAAEDPRFLQPPVGAQIYSRDGLSGKVYKVVINPSNPGDGDDCPGPLFLQEQ
jgi:osmotically-inducible protein OsmY